MKRLMFCTLNALILMPFVASSAPAQTVAQKDSLFEQLFLFHINKQRESAGKAPLALDDRISAMARSVALGFSNGSITPNTIRGQRAAQRLNVLQRVFGAQTAMQENFQPTGTPESVPKFWMTRNTERGRMLSDSNLVGVGVSADKNGVPFYAAIFVKAPGQTKRPRPLQAMSAAKGSLFERLFLLHINKQRQSAGKAPLKLDDRISLQARNVALGFSNGTIQPQTIRGKRAEQRLSFFRAVFGSQTAAQENFQPTGTPESVPKFWMTRKNERTRMLSDANFVGLGVSADNKGVPFYAAIFVKSAGTRPSTEAVITFVNLTKKPVSVFFARARQKDEFVATIQLGRTIRKLPIGKRVVVKNSDRRVLENFTVGKAQTVTLKAPAVIQPKRTIAQLEQDLFKEINRKRAENRLPPVKLDRLASDAARTWSQELADAKVNNPRRYNDFFTKPGPEGEARGHWGLFKRARRIMKVYGSRSFIRENTNPTGTPRDVVDRAWFISIDHRKAMLHKDVTLVGIGIARDKSPNRDLYYNAIFFRPEFATREALTVKEQTNLESTAANLINQRARKGKTALKLNAIMIRVARDFSKQLAEGKTKNPNVDLVDGTLLKAGYRSRQIVSVPATANSAKDVVDGWLRNAQLAELIGRSSFTDIGVGVTRASNGRTHWMLIWGR